jgi:hypothetical protein
MTDPSQFQSEEETPEAIARQRIRERQKLVGLMLLVLLILVLALLRFGKTVPWGAR